MQNNTSLPASIRQTFDRYIAERDFGDPEEAELALREAATELAKASPKFAALVLTNAPPNVVALVIASELGYNQITVTTVHAHRRIRNVERKVFGRRVSYEQSDVTDGYMDQQVLSLEKNQ